MKYLTRWHADELKLIRAMAQDGYGWVPGDPHSPIYAELAEISGLEKSAIRRMLSMADAVEPDAKPKGQLTPEKLLTIKEAAVILGVSPATLNNWRTKTHKMHNVLPYVKVGASVRYDYQEIIDFVRRGAVVRK